MSSRQRPAKKTDLRRGLTRPRPRRKPRPEEALEELLETPADEEPARPDIVDVPPPRPS